MKHKIIHKTTKPPRKKLLQAVFQGLRTLLERKPHGTICVQSKEVYEASGIPARTFKRNFLNADDVLYYAYEELIKVFQQFRSSPDSNLNLLRVLTFLLIELRKHAEPLRIALARSDVVFWRTALEEIKPVVESAWREQYLFESQNRMFEEFIGEFVYTLELWEKEDFSSDVVENYSGQLYYIVNNILTGRADWNSLIRRET